MHKKGKEVLQKYRKGTGEMNVEMEGVCGGAEQPMAGRGPGHREKP